MFGNDTSADAFWYSIIKGQKWDRCFVFIFAWSVWYYYLNSKGISIIRRMKRKLFIKILINTYHEQLLDRYVRPEKSQCLWIIDNCFFFIFLGNKWNALFVILLFHQIIVSNKAVLCVHESKISFLTPRREESFSTSV